MDLNEKYFQLGIGLRLITSGWDAKQTIQPNMGLNEKYFQLGIGLRLITSGWDDMRDVTCT